MADVRAIADNLMGLELEERAEVYNLLKNTKNFFRIKRSLQEHMNITSN